MHAFALRKAGYDNGAPRNLPQDAASVRADWYEQILYDNPASWGLGDAPQELRGANHVRLEYDQRATPPLVALQRIKNHAFVSGEVRI